MRNKENAGDFLCTDEERLLISRATELSVRGENSAVALSFLSPGEQRIVYEAMVREGCAGRLFFWGGYRGAERRRAIFLPSWLLYGESVREGLFSGEREEHFLSILENGGMLSICSELCPSLTLRGSGYVGLSHRDYLGALMALGLKRSVLGDICVLEDSAVLFCEEKTVDYISAELQRAGRDRLTVEARDGAIEFSYKRSFEEIRTTVATPRLDGVVRALCSVSRDEAARIVAAGLAEVNYFVQKEPDRIVGAGDVVTVRGYGKFVIDRAEDQTRRQRIRLEARKFV